MDLIAFSTTGLVNDGQRRPADRSFRAQPSLQRAGTGEFSCNSSDRSPMYERREPMPGKESKGDFCIGDGERRDDIFRFDSNAESEMFRRLDELKEVMHLPSRGHVVQFAIRELWASVRRQREAAK